MSIYRKSCLMALFFALCVLHSGWILCQISNTYSHGFNDNHTSLIKKHNGLGYVQASTILRTDNDIHLMKMDVAGAVLLDVTIQSPASDEYALDICLGNNDTYVICGYERVGLYDLGFVMTVDTMFSVLNKVHIQVAAANRHTPALRVINSAFFENNAGGYWGGDITGGYLVVGFEATGYPATQSKSAYAIKVSDALTIQWARKFDSPILPGAKDWDMCSNANWKWTGPMGYLIGGSGTSPAGEQAAMVTLLNLDGSVVWSQLYSDNATGTSWCVSADGAYDDAEFEFYHLVNFSQSQSGGIVAFNQNTGAINMARSRYLISPFNDYYSYEFGGTCANATVFISGYGLDQTAGAVQGMFPFLLRYDKNLAIVDAFGPHYAYPRQSINYAPPLSIFSPFSSTEQPRIFYPKHYASRQVNIWSVAGYEDVGVNSENHLITPYFDGKDSCDYIDPMINPVPVNIVTFPLNNVATAYNLPASSASSTPIAQVVYTCCPVNSEFTYTNNGAGCVYTFTASGAGGLCPKFEIKDISNIVIASGTGTTFVYPFTLNGTYTVCFEDCAFVNGSICSQESCQTVLVTCALGCVADADFSFTVSGCNVFLSDLTPEGNPYGCEHWNFGTMPTIMSTDTTSFTFFASGDYTICHTDCCMDIDGNLQYVTKCKTVTIVCEPPCCLPTDFVIAGTGCCFQFTPVFGNGTCPGLSYLWTFDDGKISNASNPYHCYTTSGIYTVTFSAFCGMGPSITFTKSINVTCPPPPPPGPGSLGISYKGSGGVITVKASGPIGPIWPGASICCHAWSWGDGATSQGAEASHYYETPGTYIITCTATFTLGTQTSVETATQEVTVNHTNECMCSPDAVLGLVGSPVSCGTTGHSTWLYVVDNIGEANMTYQWMIATTSGGQFSDLPGAEGIQTWVDNLPAPSYLKCRCTCNTTGATFYTSEVEISDGHFEALLSANPPTVCAGGSSELSVMPAGSTSVVWTPAVPAGSNPLVAPAATTVYHAFVNNTAGCGALAQTTVVVSNCSTPANDAPASAVNVASSSNMYYPNCYPITGDLTFATNSSESSTFNGVDSWYRFIAQSTAVSITLSSVGFDDVIELYEKVGTNYFLMSGGTENAASGVGDFERMNYAGLTIGQTYYVSVGSVSGAGGPFSLCIQHLMPSGCASATPPGGFALCNNYKATYRGSSTSGVTYTFNFTGIGGGAPAVTTSLGGTSGLVTLSHPALALRYGGVYNVAVDVDYALYNGSGTLENLIIAGSHLTANCAGVTMRAQPMFEVKSTQRCNALLLRSNWLTGVSIPGDPYVCGAQNYTYEFTQVSSCVDGTVASLFPAEYSTSGSAPYLALGVLPNLGSTGAWNVRIRPNFSYGPGTYGPVQRISVNNTSASMMIQDENFSGAVERLLAEHEMTFMYPNPNTGNAVNLRITGIESDIVVVRILDCTGRVVFIKNYSVEGVLQATVHFAEPLAAGLYVVECGYNGGIDVVRMVVER